MRSRCYRSRPLAHVDQFISRPLPRAACRRNRHFMRRYPGKRGRRRDTARGGRLCVGAGRLKNVARQESDRAGLRSRHEGESASASRPARSQRIAISASPAPDAGLHGGTARADNRAPQRRLLQDARAQAGHQGGPSLLRHLLAHRARRQRPVSRLHPTADR